MPTTLTKEKLPISDAQATEALAIARAVCESVGIVADISLRPYDDPDLKPARVALLEVALDDDVPGSTFLEVISALGTGLSGRGLTWPHVAIEPFVR